MPNFADTISNLAFVLAGLRGLAWLHGKGRDSFEEPGERLPYLVLFASTVLIGVGSGYYHLAPDDARLFWDRLPMTLGFMSIFTTVLVERVDEKAALKLFPLFLIAGAGGAVWWHLTGHLRPYAMVQFLPLLLIPAVLSLFPSRYTHGSHLWIVLLLYVAAKAAEVFDRPLLAASGFVSGHTLKHILAAVAILAVVRMLERRAPAKTAASSGVRWGSHPSRGSQTVSRH
jgi:hypothetical protein